MKPTTSCVLGAALLSAPAALPTADEQAVALVVTDTSGEFVADLEKTELAVFENGEPREILGLERDERPLALAIVLDTSESVEGPYRLQVAEATAGFLAGLPEKARFTVWVTGERPQRGTVIPDTLKLQTQIPNLQVVGFTLKVPTIQGQNSSSRPSRASSSFLATSGS